MSVLSHRIRATLSLFFCFAFVRSLSLYVEPLGVITYEMAAEGWFFFFFFLMQIATLCLLNVPFHLFYVQG